MLLIAGSAALTLTSCGNKPAEQADFKYLIDEFADLRIIRYRIDGWEDLTLQQKEYVYHLLRHVLAYFAYYLTPH